MHLTPFATSRRNLWCRAKSGCGPIVRRVGTMGNAHIQTGGQCVEKHVIDTNALQRNNCYAASPFTFKRSSLSFPLFSYLTLRLLLVFFAFIYLPTFLLLPWLPLLSHTFFISVSVRLRLCLCLSLSLSVCLSVCRLSVCLSVCL